MPTHRSAPLAALLGLAALAGAPAVAQDGRPDNPLARPKPAPFAGRFAGDGLVLELAAQGGAYTGTLTFQNQAMPCRATAQGQGLAGTFTTHGAEFPFEASPDGDGLRLSSGGRTYRLRREGGAARGAPVADDASLTVPVEHPAGVALRLPTGWTTHQLDRALLLLPPGASAQDPDPEVLHFLVVEPLDPSIRAPDDAQVTAYLDELVTGTFPNLRRSGAPQVVQTGAGATSVLTWTGTAPDGRPVKGRACAALVERNGAAVVSIGLVSRIDASEATQRAIVGSFRACESKADTRLTGKWGNNGGWSSADNRTYGSSRVELTLSPDGRFLEYSLSYVSTPAGVVESEERKGGSWQATGAVLTLRYDESGEVKAYRYTVGGDGALVCTGSGGGTARWERSQ